MAYLWESGFGKLVDLGAVLPPTGGSRGCDTHAQKFNIYKYLINSDGYLPPFGARQRAGPEL